MPGLAEPMGVAPISLNSATKPSGSIESYRTSPGKRFDFVTITLSSFWGILWNKGVIRDLLLVEIRSVESFDLFPESHADFTIP